MSRATPQSTGPLYYRVSPSIWHHRDWSDDTKLLAFYLLTSPHRSTEGLFYLLTHYMLGDLRWGPGACPSPWPR